MTFHWLIMLSFSLVLPLILGYFVLRLLLQTQTMSMIPQLALSYGLGFGLLSQWMLILGICEIPISFGIIAGPLIILSILLWLVKKISMRKQMLKSGNILFSDNQDPVTGNSQWKKMFCYSSVLYISFILLYVFWRSLNVPMQSWDAVATIAYKAKIFFFDQSIHHLNLPQAPYPLFVPFIESWIAFCLARWDDVLVKIIFPLAFSSYLVLHYYFLKSTTNKIWALGGLCLLLSSPFVVYHATIAYREIFLMYYNCTSIILLLLWNRHKNDTWLILAALFSGFTTFVKLEGTSYLLIHTCLLLLILFKNNTLTLNNKFKKLLIFAIPSYLLCLPFHIYKIHLNLSGMADRTNLVASWGHFQRIPGILYDFFWNIFLSGNWNITWIILLISLISYKKKARNLNESALLLFSLFMFFITYLVLLTFTSALIDNPTTLSRVFIHFFPLCPLLIIQLNYPLSPTA